MLSGLSFNFGLVVFDSSELVLARASRGNDMLSLVDSGNGTHSVEWLVGAKISFCPASCYAGSFLQDAGGMRQLPSRRIGTLKRGQIDEGFLIRLVPAWRVAGRTWLTTKED